MKKIIKIFGIAVLSAVVFLGITACSNGSTDSNSTSSPYLGLALDLNINPVYQRNLATTKISTAYLPYSDSFVMGAYTYDPTYIPVPVMNTTKTRTIESKHLVIPALDSSQLKGWDAFKVYFNEWEKDKQVHLSMDPAETMGNLLILYAFDVDNPDSTTPPTPPTGCLIREGLSGTNFSLSQETENYYYVDRPCTMTGTIETPDAYNTYEPFTLKLKAGWNTVCRKQTYTTFGTATYEMSLKNPNYNWVMMPVTVTP